MPTSATPFFVGANIVLKSLLYFSLFLSDVLKQVMLKCVAGAEVVSICDFGDKTLEEMTGGVYKKDKEMKKGTKHFLKEMKMVLKRAIDITDYVCNFISKCALNLFSI